MSQVQCRVCGDTSFTRHVSGVLVCNGCATQSQDYVEQQSEWDDNIGSLAITNRFRSLPSSLKEKNPLLDLFDTDNDNANINNISSMTAPLFSPLPSGSFNDNVAVVTPKESELLVASEKILSNAEILYYFQKILVSCVQSLISLNVVPTSFSTDARHLWLHYVQCLLGNPQLAIGGVEEDGIFNSFRNLTHARQKYYHILPRRGLVLSLLYVAATLNRCLLLPSDLLYLCESDCLPLYKRPVLSDRPSAVEESVQKEASLINSLFGISTLAEPNDSDNRAVKDSVRRLVNKEVSFASDSVLSDDRILTVDSILLNSSELVSFLDLVDHYPCHNHALLIKRICWQLDIPHEIYVTAMGFLTLSHPLFLMTDAALFSIILALKFCFQVSKSSVLLSTLPPPLQWLNPVLGIEFRNMCLHSLKQPRNEKYSMKSNLSDDAVMSSWNSFDSFIKFLKSEQVFGEEAINHQVDVADDLLLPFQHVRQEEITTTPFASITTLSNVGLLKALVDLIITRFRCQSIRKFQKSLKRFERSVCDKING